MPAAKRDVMKKIRPVYFAAAVAVIALLFIYEALASRHLSYDFPFVGYGGTFKFNDLKIIGIPVYWLLMICGFAVSLIVSLFRSKKYLLDKKKAVASPVLFLVISFIGAKLLYLIENSAKQGALKLELSGLSLFGAIFLITAAVPLIALIYKKRVWEMYDYFTPFGLIMLSCVRTGCFFNGCCGALTIWNGITPIILPIQLFEVICDLLILEFCFRIEEKKRGYLYQFFLFSYGICRFFLEFLRNSPKDIHGLSFGQIFSLIAIALSVGLFLLRKRTVPAVPDIPQKSSGKSRSRKKRKRR